MRFKMNWPWAAVIIFGMPTLVIVIGVISEMFRRKKEPELDVTLLRERLSFALNDERETEMVMLVIHNWLRESSDASSDS